MYTYKKYILRISLSNLRTYLCLALLMLTELRHRCHYPAYCFLDVLHLCATGASPVICMHIHKTKEEACKSKFLCYRARDFPVDLLFTCNCIGDLILVYKKCLPVWCSHALTYLF